MRAIATGVAFLVAGAGLLGGVLVEFAAGDLRGDGDNPVDGIAYLQAAPQSYAQSGGLLILGGAALIVAIAGLVMLSGAPTLPVLGPAGIGAVGGGLLILAGAIRAQASGTVPYIASLDPEWGQSAYLAVHLAGTQGALSAGAYATGGWLLVTAIVAVRRRIRWLVLAAIPPAAVFSILLADLAGASLPDILFPVMVGCLAVGIPLGTALVGLAVLIPASRARLAAPAPARGT